MMKWNRYINERAQLQEEVEQRFVEGRLPERGRHTLLISCALSLVPLENHPTRYNVGQ